MIVKEFRDIIKPVLIGLSAFLVIPLIHFSKLKIVLNTSDASVPLTGYFFIAAIILCSMSGFLGITAFKTESQDNGFEYLLSSPLSKAEILKNKLIPRIGVILLFMLVYTGTYFLIGTVDGVPDAGKMAYIAPVFLFPWVLLFFFANFFVSLFKQRNWIAMSNLLSAYLIFLFPFVCREMVQRLFSASISEQGASVAGFYLSFTLLFLLLGVPFYRIFQRFDLREQFRSGAGYVKRVFPLQVGLIAFGIWVWV